LTLLGIYFIRLDEAEAKPVSIAVLPMKSLTNEPDLGWNYLHARRYDVAIVQLKEVLELDANLRQARALLANCYAKKGMYTEII
jgi:Tfp pilus assembly protein PilF